MTENDSRPPEPIAPLASVLGGAHDTARQYALKHHLVAEDGQLYCWECNRLGGTLPSLHCLRCLEDFRSQQAREKARAALEHPENKRWRSILLSLETASIDREMAEKWIRHAEALSSATPDRMRDLWRIFEQRWPEKSAPRNWGGRGFRRSGTE